MGYIDIVGRTVTGEKYDVAIGVNPKDSEFNACNYIISNAISFISKSENIS